MELAAALHHSAYKGAGPETNDALRSQKTVNSREEAVFFELCDEDTAKWRPPQARVQRHTSEQMIESFVPVPILDLDAPVPQIGGYPENLRPVVGRAGYRSARDHSSGQGPAPCCSSFAAAGGTVGGSAGPLRS